tara:strand:- start:617 stop:1684 length:1068 start_codon:yes stop_codon:yes gene_type:complete
MGLNEKLFTGGAGSSPLVPSDNFNTVLYTGNGSAQNIDTVGFQPDFTWIKQRNDTNPHSIFDSVRGAGKLLSSQTTSEQSGNAGDLLGSFRPLGFQVNRTYLSSNFDNTNLSGATYVAWNWKAGGAKVTIAANTVGNTIASDVSANVAAGFSIVDYQANSTQGATIAHGLESPPEMIITKEYTGARVWCVYHKDLTDYDYYLELNTTSGETDSVNTGYAAVPGSTVYTVGTSSVVNDPSSDSYIAYCFHSVAGYSKIGTYNGNNGSNPITTGFRPAFLMIKRSTASGSWLILDNKRETSNPRHTYLFPASGSTESVVASNLGYDVDFDNNGFELKGSGGDVNASGGKYIFMAFAE